MEIEVVDARTLSYEAFCTQYMAQNRPVRLVNVVKKWFPQACAWRVTQDTGEMAINYGYLRANYGDQEVPVVDGESTEYGCQAQSTMRFADYLDLMQQKRAGKQYLKDWHFVHAVHPSPPLYTTPVYFQDDWLNWWWDRKDESSDDYRFVYIGPAGSWTPLHHDVFRSYSWSVNVCGQKEWIFFHPDEESKLKDKFGRTVLPDITSKDYDKDLYPRAHEATPLYVVQDSGEAIFVPSGWYHQVRNVRDTISINHNWFNGFNILEIWSFFKSEYAAVETELEHLKEIGLTGLDFRDQCQLIMQANTGMNYVEFRQLVEAKVLDLKEHSIPDSNDWEIKTTENHLNQLLLIQAELDAYFNASEFSS
ncbi:hypothetical protein Poli38472_006028 [Pythium oligandrum]|uniref:JmjC domain-containing protein n=1 Tax=Pythium oligandrum TaxID=41045 RepID=A0A8K1CS59_PYTOL|nr:hypothetical protein Poli38472_006028 [Pythium oligandrum]|eukprot:TMW68560.1 hypothetical protein Poli38472_006028 [Pythium oligandrum]